MSHLTQELGIHLRLRQRIQEQFPNTDEETLADTIEGLTRLDEVGLPCRKWSESRVRIGPLLNGERHAASAIYVRADHREAA